jgi:biofilm PGA synthesis protein PgaA
MKSKKFASILKNIFSIFAPISLLGWLILSTVQANETGQQRYQEALNFAKEKQYQKSLILFKTLRAEYPNNMTYLSDYVQILASSGKDKAVLRLADEVPLNKVRAYVIDAIAHSARNLKRYQKSQFLYETIIQRYPKRIESYLGLSFVYIDQGHTQAALNVLFPLNIKYPNHTEIIFTIAYAYEKSGQLFKALKYYNKVLALNNQHRYATKRRILTTSKLGAPALAKQMAKQVPNETFDNDEKAHLRWDTAAYWVRWGEIGNDANDRLRFNDTERAIEEISQNIAYAESTALKEATWHQKARFDLLLALRDRVYMQRVVDEAQTLFDENIVLPTPSLIAVGDAYLYLEQPDLAEKYYLQALANTAKSFPLRMSLFYTYLERENYDDSKAMIKQLVSEQARKHIKKYFNPITQKTKTLTAENPNKTQSESVLAISNAYFADMDQAEIRTKSLSDNAPHNQGLRSNLGTVYYWRGWPRRAQEEFEIGLSMEPKNVGLKIALARNFLELRQYRDAEKQVTKVYERYPENKHAQKQYHLWEVHDDPQFIVNVNGSESRGAQQNGSRGLEMESYLYSAPIDYDFRVFGHYRWTKATFTEGKGETHHQGVGVEYTQPNYRLTAEIHNNIYAKNTVGVSLGGDYQFDDQWSISSLFESFSAQTPLRALKNNIYARSFNVTGTFRQHESRTLSLGATYLNFTDGNNRFGLNASYFQRWYTGPLYKFATHTNLSYGQNSKTNVPYYSPSHQLGAEITLENDWLTYQHYDTSWHQRLALTLGNSWQQGFNNDFIYSLAYEHRWKAMNRVELSYGASYGRRFYDGDKEYSWQYFMRLNWRF